MKKIIALLLTVCLCFSITSCKEVNSDEISCEEIIAAYKSEGYSVLYHGHDDDTSYHELGIYCSFEIIDPENPEKNYMYVCRYFDKDAAEAERKDRRFNPIIWLLFSVYGEWRWLKNGCYGDIYYETFNSNMIKPLRRLANSHRFM